MSESSPKQESVHEQVQSHYGSIARGEASASSAAGGVAEYGRTVGYSESELEAVPEGANLGLGCGNPTALAAMKPGDVVVDLGSGGGFDAFLAARQVGPAGRVIGVDMTEDMIERARKNAAKAGFENVEFYHGMIEKLPLPDASADVVISNCVINLSPDKPAVFREAGRVLRPGGRMLVSDLVTTRPIPEALRGSVEAYVGCIAGAMLRDAYLDAIGAAGFSPVEVLSETSFGSDVRELFPQMVDAARAAGIDDETIDSVAGSIMSLKISATKPIAGTGH